MLERRCEGLLKLSLEAARVNAELSQQEMAEKMSVSRPTYGAWERGDSVIGPGQVMLFCSIVGVGLDDIRLPEKRPKKTRRRD